MNKVILIGNLANNPEAFTTQSGVNRSSFRIAVQRKYKNADGGYDADFLPVIAWRQTADFCNKYLAKGRKVAVEGSIQVRSYEADDGSKRYVTEIIADSVEGLGRARGADPGPDAPPERGRPDDDEFVEVDDDEEAPF